MRIQITKVFFSHELISSRISMSSAAADAEIIVTNLLRRIASFRVNHSDALYLLYKSIVSVSFSVLIIRSSYDLKSPDE